MATLTERSPIHIQEIVLPPHVELVPAQYTEDTLLHWTEWINKPDVRQWMTANIPSSRTEVKEWLYNATHDEYRHYFTIMAEGKAVGLISLRQDQNPDTSGEIGIAIGDPAYRGKRVGTQALGQLLEFASGIGVTHLRAHIKPENSSSLRLFTRYGFAHTGDATLNNEVFMKFEKITGQQMANPNFLHADMHIVEVR